MSITCSAIACATKEADYYKNLPDMLIDKNPSCTIDSGFLSSGNNCISIHDRQ